MTRRQRRLLKKTEQARERAPKVRRIHAWHVISLVLGIGVVGAVIYSAKPTSSNGPTPAATTYTDKPVHWHAKIDIDVCGEKRDLPGSKSGQMVGIPLYHHHGDNTWHIEGRILQKEDITLGRFFDKHRISFDRDRIMDKKNGDECTPGKPGQVKMFVNGEANMEFREYVGQYTPEAKDHVIRIVFE